MPPQEIGLRNNHNGSNEMQKNNTKSHKLWDQGRRRCARQFFCRQTYANPLNIWVHLQQLGPMTLQRLSIQSVAPLAVI